MIYYVMNDNYIEILNITISQFMDYTPPCKECLVKTMCMEISCKNCASVFQFLELKIKHCDKLMGFIVCNKDFETLEYE